MLRAVSKFGRFHRGTTTTRTASHCIGTTAGLSTPLSKDDDAAVVANRRRQFHFRAVTGMGVSMASSSMGQQMRFKSTSTEDFADSGGDSSEPSFEDTMDKLFVETQKQAQGEGDEWFLDEAANAWEPTWYNLADHAVNIVNSVQELTGWQYATTIVAVTCTLRLLIFPLAVRGQRAASRMAHLQPELAQLKEQYEKLGTPTQAEQKVFAGQMKAVFKKYEVKPFAAMTAPLIQAPMFLGMFFGMKKMPELFPEELSTGGLLWFTDLTLADPTYILPLTCGVSFLATIEAGKEQMVDANPKYGPIIVNAFRAMAVIMVPVITTFPATMLCYWVPNNILTMTQSITLRNAWVKKQFGIWDRPKPVPGSTPDLGFQETMNNLVKQAKGEPTTEAQKMKAHNEEIEIQKRVRQLSRSAKERRRAAAPSFRRRK